jgi:hypothetical protein
MDYRASDIARWQLLTLLVIALATILGGVGIIARFVLVMASPIREIAGQTAPAFSPDSLERKHPGHAIIPVADWQCRGTRRR